MAIFDSKVNINDTIQSGLIDFGKKSVTKTSYQTTTSNQYTTSSQDVYDYSRVSSLVYQPSYIINSAGATNSPTSTPSFTKKTELISDQTPSITQTPQTIQGSVTSGQGSSGGIMSNINDIVTIGIIGIIGYFGYKAYKKSKGGK